MKPYTKVYFEFFGYTEADFIPCECCGKETKDIHHIWARSIKRALYLKIENLQALCRECHTKYGDKKQHREYLQNIHNEKMNNHGNER